MTHTQVNQALISRHTEALPHVWPVVESYGLTIDECIKGTGLSLAQAQGRETGMTLEQEYSLYRNLLNLTGDKHLGLKLGALYHPQTYGMFGYALMSARNASTVMEVSSRFLSLPIVTFA